MKERQVSFVKCGSQDGVSNAQWRLYRQNTSPAIFVGRPVTVPVMRTRPQTQSTREKTLTQGISPHRQGPQGSQSSPRGYAGVLSQGSPLGSPGRPARSRREEEEDLEREASQLFERERSRLMEKPGVAATSHRQSQQDAAAAWGEKGGGGGVQHTQYIRRLADLRDELINQEETALARALDRLRLHSITNRDAARYRLKIKEPPQSESPRMSLSTTTTMTMTQGTTFPRPMVTTVEKFRQMRPEKHAPVIFPLQGKQLIEASHSASGGGSVRSSGEEGHGGGGGGSRVEDTVKANLQRLIQPTSSIPNIGRKALRQPGQDALELKPQSMHNMRNRVFKSSQRPHLASPFMVHQDDDSGGGGDGGGRGDSRRDSENEFHMSPHTYKLGPMTDGDRLDMEKLNQYYYVYCLPRTPSGGDAGGELGPERRSTNSLSMPQQGQQQRNKGLKPGPQKRRIHSERERGNVSHSHVSRPYSDRAVVSSDSDVDGGQYNGYRQHFNQYKHSVDSLTLPVIPADGESSQHYSNGYHDPSDHPSAAFITQRGGRVGGMDTPGSDFATGRRRRHIVVDMPHIIFNSATPDLSREASNLDNGKHPLHHLHHHHLINGGGGGTLPPPPTPSTAPHESRPGTLSKTLKQKELRHRELQNLLEDVKELNKRTETLQAVEMDAAASVS